MITDSNKQLSNNVEDAINMCRILRRDSYKTIRGVEITSILEKLRKCIKKGEYDINKWIRQKSNKKRK